MLLPTTDAVPILQFIVQISPRIDIQKVSYSGCISTTSVSTCPSYHQTVSAASSAKPALVFAAQAKDSSGLVGQHREDLDSPIGRAGSLAVGSESPDATIRWTLLESLIHSSGS